MKKTFSLFLLLCFAVMGWAEPYAVRVFNSDFSSYKDYAATATGEADFQGREQYAALGVTLNATDVLQCYDGGSGAVWAITQLDEYGAYQRFTVTSSGIKCNSAGTYNIYIKMKFGDDMFYIEDANASIGGGDTGGGSDCADGPYGVQVNGTTVYDAVNTGEVDFQGRTQYLAHVKLEAGDVCKLINTSCNATWMVDMDPYDEYVNFEGGKAAGQITCKKAGCYDFYIKLMMNDDLLYIGAGTDCEGQKQGGGNDENNKNKTTYNTQAPAQCGDVMLQGFYYDSYSAKKYNGVSFSDTKWATLLAQADEIGAYFDLIWLPPSAKSSGGTGYHPSQYSNQNSAWGSRADLEKLIATLHNSPRKTKVIADIVVNHMDNKSTWCDFWPQDFTPYGTFQPEASWITANDELATTSSAGSCKGKQGSNYDDGYGDEANYAAARDLDHNNAQVRNMCKAYLKWMYNVIGYDGWRYDYCKGFHNSHVNDYNASSGAYFSVMEYWDGNADVLVDHINQAGKNTLTFDFATKYEAFNRGIAAGNYSGCKGSGLLGKGYGRYACTFIDSHDSFQRDDNEMCGKNNSLNSANKNKVLQANAFLLSMPGVPCVFYPHWVVFKDEISKMIMARHIAGVHSESSVQDEASSSGYKAVITGKTGSLILLLGNRANDQIGSDYKVASKGTGYAVYYKGTSANADAPVVMVSPGTSTFKDKTAGIDVTVSAITLSGTPTIYYTTDGTDPTTSSKTITNKGKLNFKETTTLKVMAVVGSSKSAVVTNVYTYKEPQTTPVVVKFYKPSTWDKVYLWAWGTGVPATDFKAWPGMELTNSADGWYSYTFPAEVQEVNFIFNGGNGKEQTSDLWTDEDVCYSWSGGDGKLETECNAPTAVENVAAENITIYPNPVRDLLNIETSQTISNSVIYNLAGQCQKIVRGNEKTIDVNGMASGMYILQLQTVDGQKNTQLFIKQ